MKGRCADTFAGGGWRPGFAQAGCGHSPTTIKLRVAARQQQLIRLDFEDQPSHEVLADKLDDYQRLVDAHDVVILSDYGKGGLTHVARMIELARQPASRCRRPERG